MHVLKEQGQGWERSGGQKKNRTKAQDVGERVEEFINHTKRPLLQDDDKSNDKKSHDGEESL